MGDVVLRDTVPAQFDDSGDAFAEYHVAAFDALRDEASEMRRKTVWAAVLRDQSGEGFAEYSAMLSLFAVQCVVGALVVSRNIDHIIQAIRAIF